MDCPFNFNDLTVTVVPLFFNRCRTYLYLVHPYCLYVRVGTLVVVEPEPPFLAEAVKKGAAPAPALQLKL